MSARTGRHALLLLAAVAVPAVAAPSAAAQPRPAPVAVNPAPVASAPARVAAEGASGGEAITRYEIAMTVRADGSMHVREVIEYDFAGAPDRHGITRLIPVEFAYDDQRRRVYPIENIEVSSPSRAPADVKVDGGAVETIRIGDPDETVSGVQTYVLDYDVRGVVNTFEDRQELYWNAVGTEWEAPVAQSTVTVEGPAPIGKVACYQGRERSTEECASASVSTAGAARFTAGRLTPGEGLTVVAAFPAGTFPQAAPILEDVWRVGEAFALTPVTGAGAVGVLGLLGGWVIGLAGRRGRDQQYLGVTPGLEPGTGQEHRVALVPLARRDPVAVQFTPPRDMRPGQLGTLLDERANVLDVTATIVDLAVRGYLTIEEVEPPRRLFGGGDWRLVRSPEPPRDDLHDYEQALLTAIFTGRDQVLLSDLKQTFQADLRKVQRMLYEDVTRQGWFRGDPSSVRTRYLVYGVLLVLAGLALTWLLAAFTSFGLVGIAVVIGGFLLVALAPRMPARTARGTALLAQAKGFRTYLETAEAEQIRFEEGSDVFSRYLPYAIVFGVAERWAGVFQRLADSGVDVGAPTWYVGSGPGPFTYYAFGSSMGSFATTTSGSIAAATPSSSGSSGFGGSGFSGGGGGGGGGGSW